MSELRHWKEEYHFKIDFLGKYTASAVMKISTGQAQTAPSK